MDIGGEPAVSATLRVKSSRHTHPTDLGSRRLEQITYKKSPFL